MLKRFGWLWVMVSILPVVGATAQRMIPDPLSCPRCAIEARTILRIGGLDSPLPSEPPADVVVDGRGRFWVFSWNATPIVFDAAGKAIHEFKRGAGPNETGFAEYAILTPGDSVTVFDGENRRISVFASDLTANRSVALTGSLMRPRVVRWPDWLIAVQPAASSRQAPQAPLRIVNLSAGTVQTVGSFGRIRSDLTGFALVRSSSRAVSTVRAGKLWEAERTRYNLYQWQVDGVNAVLLDSLQRRPTWFAEEGSPGKVMSQPMLNHVEADAIGLVWVFLNQPTGEPVSAATPRGAARGEERTDQIAYEKLFRTVIEVIDPKAARVVARTTVPSILSTVLSDGRAVFYNVDRDGIPYIEVMTLRVVGR